MKARYFTKDDLLQVQEIITSNTKMHGVDISKVTDKFVQMFATREPGRGSICVVDNNEIIQGILKVTWSDKIPVWFIDFAFMKHTADRNLVRQTIKTCAAGVDFITDEAEKRGLYDFYYGVRDHLDHRLDLLVNASLNFKERYEVSNVELLQPGQASKFAVFDYTRMLLGTQNTKTIVIRHAHLRKEFRPQLWATTV